MVTLNPFRSAQLVLSCRECRQAISAEEAWASDRVDFVNARLGGHVVCLTDVTTVDAADPNPMNPQTSVCLTVFADSTQLLRRVAGILQQFGDQDVTWNGGLEVLELDEPEPEWRDEELLGEDMHWLDPENEDAGIGLDTSDVVFGVLGGIRIQVFATRQAR